MAPANRTFYFKTIEQVLDTTSLGVSCPNEALDGHSFEATRRLE